MLYYALILGRWSHCRSPESGRSGRCGGPDFLDSVFDRDRVAGDPSIHESLRPGTLIGRIHLNRSQAQSTAPVDMCTERSHRLRAE